MASMVEVEVKKWQGAEGKCAYGWQRISIEEALRSRDEIYRCPECYGRITPTRASTTKTPMAAQGEHQKRQDGCSLGDCFNGTKSKHPLALP